MLEGSSPLWHIGSLTWVVMRGFVVREEWRMGRSLQNVHGRQKRSADSLRQSCGETWGRLDKLRYSWIWKERSWGLDQRVVGLTWKWMAANYLDSLAKQNKQGWQGFVHTETHDMSRLFMYIIIRPPRCSKLILKVTRLILILLHGRISFIYGLRFYTDNYSLEKVSAEWRIHRWRSLDQSQSTCRANGGRCLENLIY